MPISHHCVEEVTIGCFASHWITPSGWSCMCEPTPGASTRTSIPTSARCSAGPIPDSMSSLGESMAPADRTTSCRAVNVR
jgi:hypothetical protein